MQVECFVPNVLDWRLISATLDLTMLVPGKCLSRKFLFLTSCGNGKQYYILQVTKHYNVYKRYKTLAAVPFLLTCLIVDVCPAKQQSKCLDQQEAWHFGVILQYVGLQE